MRHVSVVAVAITAIAALGVSVAFAKMPGFMMEVSPSTVAPGAPITVTVTLDTTDWPAESLTGWVGFARKPPGDEAIRPLREHVEVPLPKVRPDVYQGSVEAPDEPGEYVVVPFPTAMGPEDGSGGELYPDTAIVTVAEPIGWGLKVGPAVGIAALAGIVVVRRRRHAIARNTNSPA